MSEIVATDEAVDVQGLLDSLAAVGVWLWLDDTQVRYRAPQGVMTAERLVLLRNHREQIAAVLADADGVGTVRPDPQARYDPFPLTDIQAAYLVGRGGGYAWGGVGCHGYGELSFPDVDPQRLDRAWAAVVRRHDMLRAVVNPDGTQQVLREAPPCPIRVDDRRGRPAEEYAAAVRSSREQMDHRVYQPGQWPLFDMRLTVHDHESILHFSIDFLVADFVSLERILAELEQEYRDPGSVTTDTTVAYRDAMLAIRAGRSGPRAERDRAYWSERLDSLPDRPDLPLRPAQDAPPRFERRQLRLSTEDWTALCARARAGGLTPSSAVLAAYAEVLGRWCRTPRFTVNVTVLNRPSVHPDINAVIGDFTSVELLAVTADADAPLRQRAAALQGTLWEDLDHGSFSGIDVIRQLRRRDSSREHLFPVVFTSSIGLSRERGGAPSDTAPANGGAGVAEPGGMARLVHGISQTPQVWLDCQAMELAGGLSVNWDLRAGVFADGVVEAMFEAFGALLHRMATDDGVWDEHSPVPVPAGQLAQRPGFEPARWTGSGVLHERVLEQARRTPQRPAVICGNRVLTYAELVSAAATVARAVSATATAGDMVAVEMDKGWEQVVGALGVLWAGCAYVPVDPGQPRARRDRILADVGARCLLTQSWLAAAEPRPELETIAVDELPVTGEPFESTVDDDSLAYVIYTSGSTGTPKGVMIAHRAAWNTIADINERFGVGEQDRVLGVANLGFDLSVYDIFGPLSVGGALVLPQAGRRGDPAHWAELVGAHGVTVWNSVPSQLEMLVSYLQSTPEVTVPSLRLALLSGDWIRVGLPDAVRRLLPAAEVVSLGGATEASIWSITHPASTVDPGLPSIPYGRQLTGQRVEVLGAGLVAVPDLVPGEIYIGGDGLAVGYFGDPGRTAERFVRQPATGRRLYRTGDLGRYLPDGSIEFLGREDTQVKIRGYRVELAEVEAVLGSHPAVAAAAVVTTGTRPEPLRLAAFVEPATGTVASPEEPAELAALAIDQTTAFRAQVDEEQMLAFARELDATALLQMMWALRECGLFAGDSDAHRVQEILDTGRISVRHHRLVRRWLQALEGNGLLRADPETGALRATGRGSRDLAGAAAVEAGWQRVAELTPDTEDRTELISYFRTAAGRLPELLRGEVDPLTLLFPQAQTQIHEAAYNGMFLSRYVNKLLVSAASELARRHRGPEPFRVLEVGSGVGGTSVVLIPALAEFDVEYVFSDVSEFFLNNARARYQQYPWMDYRLYDMNVDYRAQGLAPNSYELVVCANVLHYAKNADAALARLRELVKPGGWVLFIEATRDSYQIMTSMEFLFDHGSGDFVDARRAREQTFLTREQWLDVIAGTGADGMFTVPLRDPITDEMGMQVFGARFKADRAPVRRAELAAHLTDQLPAYMLPAQLQVVDRLPVTDNGKVDRATLRSWLHSHESAPSAAADDPPTGELEVLVAEVWHRLLPAQRIGRRQNFFELGGDSLLAAQVAAELRDKLPVGSGLYYDNLLRLLLENATVAGLAATIVSAGSAAGSEQSVEHPPLVELGEGDGATVVLVHDETGELTGWRPLLDALGFGVPLAGLRVADPAGYLATPPDVLVDRIATQYTRALVQAGHTRVRLIGQHFGGIVAAELARQLAEVGVEVEQLVVVAAATPPWPVDDEYVAEYLFHGTLGVDPAQLGLPPVDGSPHSASELLAALRVKPREERFAALADRFPGTDLAAAFEVFRHGCAATGFALLPYAGDITVVRPEPGAGPWPKLPEDMRGYWEDVCLGSLETLDVPGDYHSGATLGAAALAALLRAPAGGSRA